MNISKYQLWSFLIFTINKGINKVAAVLTTLGNLLTSKWVSRIQWCVLESAIERSWWNLFSERPIFTMGLNIIFANPIGSATRTHSFPKNKHFVLYSNSSEMPSSQESQLLSASAAFAFHRNMKAKTYSVTSSA